MKYRVRKIWIGANGNQRYDLNQLKDTTISDLASYVSKEITQMSIKSVDKQMREALAAMVHYEITAHCWGTLWTSRFAADIFVETLTGWSSSQMMAASVLSKLTMHDLLIAKHTNEGMVFAVNYSTLAQTVGVEIIPEAYSE